MADAMMAVLGLPIPQTDSNLRVSKVSKQVFSLETIKKILLNEKLACLELDELAKYCSKVQLKTSGTKTELIERLKPLKNESLFDKRVNLISKHYKFKTSLSRENVPPPTAGWKFDTSIFPKLNQDQIEAYQSAKRQGKIGQYRKALRMLNSRRMKTIKVLRTGQSELFIKASVLKSYTSDVTRTVTVKFDGNVPKQAYCECAVGTCGLCCHAILVLLQLKHFTQHDKFILGLTCTQKLQTWHNPNKAKRKDNVKVKAASHIRLKYFRNARSARKNLKHKRSKKKVQDSSDVDRSDWFSRDVSKISSNVLSRLEKSNHHISNHFFKALSKYKIKSGLYHHLSYKNAYLCSLVQQDHNYVLHHEIYDNTILAPKFSGGTTEDVWHSVLDPAKTQETSSGPYTASCESDCIFSKSHYSLQKDTITVKLPKCEDVKLCGSNYVNVIQRSKEWLASRVGIITASKLPALLGLCGHKEFDSSWFCVNKKLDESLYKPKKFKNFERRS